MSPVALGVTHRDFVTTAAGGRVMGDVVDVDLTHPEVRTDLLTPGAVAARAPVAAMANGSGAVAGINGDFFDIGRTNAPAGPAVTRGQPLKAAVPHGRRMGPAVPGAEIDYVFAVGVDRVGRIDRLRLEGQVTGKGGTFPVRALNQYAVPVGGVGVFTPDWGVVDRARTLCGTDVDRDAPCAAEQAEVLVHDGAVAMAGPPVGGRIPDGDVVLTGRDEGAAAVRSLRVGDPVTVAYSLVPASGVQPQFAIGGTPVLVDSRLVAGLDDRARAPRSAVGMSRDGRHIALVTLDGRQSDSVGATLAELATLLREMGLDDAVNLDGGGSSTLVHRAPGAPEVAVVNDPSDPSARLVPNGIGVFAG
ncbi:phosphodiester glycosidase family protein [Pseudonocardia xinjiangensis]|uniref:Phosphodiester glycosidase family protein n=2 Tax=Pseudonocardia xinjiangensis TaxID=75289 RepID=A0ABX1RCR3_9PSEU|nr:phosphodiester glycosidase family protein [Pseudonocardia xinjiangensis]